MTSLAHNLKNDTRFDDLKAAIEKLAQTSGSGRDSRIKWGLRLLDAAYEGIIDLTADKHGKGEDDAVHLAAHYALHERNATQFDTRSDSGRTQISKARTVIKCGAMVSLGRGEPVNTVNNLMNERRKLRQKGVEGLDDAFTTLLRFCRLQLKSPRLIDTPEELRAICMKPAPKRKSIEDKLKAMYKDVDSMIKGTMQHGEMQFDCDELQLAREGLKDALHVFKRGGSTSSEDATEQGPWPTPPGFASPSSEDNPYKPLADAIGTLYGKPTEDLPPIVTMDDIEAQRAREESEMVNEHTAPPEDETEEDEDIGTADGDDDEGEDALRC